MVIVNVSAYYNITTLSHINTVFHKQPLVSTSQYMEALDALLNDTAMCMCKKF